MLIEPVDRVEISARVAPPFALPMCLILLLGPFSHAAHGQLSPTPLSTLPQNPSSTFPSTPDLPHGPQRAKVSFTSGELTVVAMNSSLNQILREIGRQTGMKIIGGVAEDHVFGTYGPASPSTILAILLDGTSSNMLIVQDGSNMPMQLILTPRTGGVSPPNPNGGSFDDSDRDTERPPVPVQSALPPRPTFPINAQFPNRTGTGGNPAAAGPSSSQQIAFPPIDANTPSSTATTSTATPEAAADAVKTPQQIFEQLQRLRQQQQQVDKPQ